MDNFFKRRRQELGLSQFAMAVKLGVTTGLVGLWDRNKLVPSTPISDLAAAYETTERRIEQAIIEVRRAVEEGKRKRAAVA